VYLTDNDIFIPDAMIVCDKNLIKQNGIHGAPDLVAEVLSPSTAKNDKGYKKQIYEQCGVKEYWLVDTANHSVEVYSLQDKKLEFDNVYAIYPDYVVTYMTETERNGLKYKFTPAFFPEMIIDLEKVFEGMV